MALAASALLRHCSATLSPCAPLFYSMLVFMAYDTYPQIAHATQGVIKVILLTIFCCNNVVNHQAKLGRYVATRS